MPQKRGFTSVLRIMLTMSTFVESKIVTHVRSVKSEAILPYRQEWLNSSGVREFTDAYNAT